MDNVIYKILSLQNTFRITVKSLTVVVISKFRVGIRTQLIKVSKKLVHVSSIGARVDYYNAKT